MTASSEEWIEVEASWRHEEMARGDDPLRHAGRMLWGAGIVSAVIAALYGLLHWLEMPVGTLVDWLVSLAGFWWLLIVVTIPWNIHFGAKAVLDELALGLVADEAQRERDRRYAQGTKRRALGLALALHLGSCAIFLGLALAGLTPVGYLGAAAALLLTGLRPSVRAYRYVSHKLRAIRRQARYPRDDVRTVLARLDDLHDRTRTLEGTLDAFSPLSWRHSIDDHLRDQGHALAQLETSVSELQHDLDQRWAQLARQRQQDIEGTRREWARQIAQLNEDSQFLSHIREILIFLRRDLFATSEVTR